jgi:hypothetical protein
MGIADEGRVRASFRSVKITGTLASSPAASIGDLLRKAVALDGRGGLVELRDWAAKELQGYGPDDELPEDRKIATRRRAT